jgi:hypothetical protein
VSVVIDAAHPSALQLPLMPAGGELPVTLITTDPAPRGSPRALYGCCATRNS